MLGSRGLTAVSTAHLKHLLRAVHRGELPCPITRQGLAGVGLLHVGDDLRHLQGLGQDAVVAVLVAVIVERPATPGPSRP